MNLLQNQENNHVRHKNMHKFNLTSKTIITFHIVIWFQNRPVMMDRERQLHPGQVM